MTNNQIAEPVLVPLERRLWLMLRLSEVRFRHALEVHLEPLNLTPDHCLILIFLEQQMGPASQEDAIITTRMPRVDFLLRAMELADRRLITRECEGSDISLAITTLGRALLGAASDLYEDTIREHCGDMGEEQFRQGMSFLYKLSGLCPSILPRPQHKPTIPFLVSGVGAD